MKKIVGKIILFLFGGIIAIVSLWYFLGDNLFFLFLKNNSNIEICHESCMYDRTILENSLLFLAKHRPWLKNKILKTILNQKQPGEYRVLLLDTYLKATEQKYLSDKNKKIISLIDDPQTPSILKEAIISYYTPLKVDKSTRNRWKEILSNPKENRNVKLKILGQIERTKDLEIIPFLIKLVKKEQNEIGWQASSVIESMLGKEKLSLELIRQLKEIIWSNKVHPSIKKNIVYIFYDHPENGKNILRKIYKFHPNKYLQYYAGGLLNNIENKKTYFLPIISDEEWDRIIKYDTSSNYHFTNETDWIKKVFNK